jgi:cytochrome c oxidase subunit 1
MAVAAEHAPAHHAPPQGFLWKWIFSKDHKVIGIQYFFLAMFSVFLGMGLSLVMRLQLAFTATGGESAIGRFVLGLPEWMTAAMLDPAFYLKMVTMHGTLMVFMVLTTAPQGGFGNFVLPIQIGAADMAFPTLNMLSFWTTFVALALLVAAFFVPSGAPLGGWTGYPPLSALGEIAGPGQGWGVNLWILSIAAFCLGSLLGALNFLSTTLALRTRGMSLLRMPLTVWAWFTTAVLTLLAFPVLLGGGILLLMDRLAGTSFFLPSGLVVAGQQVDHSGGSPILWQHLFWFFGHPEVYIAIIPGMGAVSNILSTFARKPIFGYKAMVGAIFAIGALGFFVWGHHMFMSGMSPYSAITFSIVTLSIGVPSAIKTFNWLGTLWGARIRFQSPMLYALGFVSLFVTGGLSGIFLGQTSVDFWFHDTYFVVGHFHMIMGVAAIFGIFAATVFWFPKMFGRMMNETLSKVHFLLTFIGVYLIFIPMHAMGIAGHPRRYFDATLYEFLASANELHTFVSWAAIATAAAQVIFLVNFFWSLFRGQKAPVNPWEATTLEWTVPSPPPHDNFGGEPPVVNHGPYEFAVPGAAQDYVMQTAPASASPGH